ncbi:MAG: PEP-CTERM sorting domain-containing protein [Roseibacillus sp.]|jgi:hypothetical protein
MRLLYLAFLGVLLPLCAEGVIIYRSIAPGEVADSSEGLLRQYIDLDGNGTLDFFTTTAGNDASIVPTGNNRILSIVATLPDLGRGIVPLLGGEAIEMSPLTPMSWNGLADRINQFDDGGSYIYKCNGRVPIGQPPECNSLIPGGLEIRYVALELETEGEIHYGWVAISSNLTVLHTVQVSGWAYETDPGVSIIAGAIPEPSGVLLLCLASVLGILRRSR